MEVAGRDIQSFQDTIKAHSEYDFSQYSHTSLRRRLTRILLELEMSIPELNKRLEGDHDFLETIVNKLTVNTTELFRDPDIWKRMKTDLIPALSVKPDIYIWHPGCSTGQEIYSMMMILDQLGILHKSHIFGSDLNTDVIESAKLGSYKYHFNQSYLENFDKVMLNGSETSDWNHRKQWKQYFQVDETRDVIQMKEFLRSKPVYKKLDLVKDPNLFLVKFDLIVCRNVIIYFNNELQNRVFELFHNNLNEHGILWLGVHESIMGPFTKRFVKKDPFYHKAPG